MTEDEKDPQAEEIISRCLDCWNAFLEASEDGDEPLARDYVIDYRVTKTSTTGFLGETNEFIYVEAKVNDELNYFGALGIYRHGELVLVDTEVDTEWRSIGYADYDHEQGQRIWTTTHKPE